MNKLGFGFLRLPFSEGAIDEALLNQMVDAYMAEGGRYFDTAYTYLGGKSEEAIRRCVVERKSRESFLLCDKLPGYLAKSREDCERFFAEQLKRCAVTYFDVYMLHWLNAKNYAIAKEVGEFDFLRQLKEQGRANKIGFSYHDSPELLDEILTAHPEVDCVLLQINYLDWMSPSIQSKRCYETAVSHGVSVIAMEPIKGGTLAKVPEEVEKLLRKADPVSSPVAQAIQFVQSLEGVCYVLSGMNSLEQIRENVKIPTELREEHRKTLLRAAQQLRSSIQVPCTGCGYCRSQCPKRIPIPKIFALYNDIGRNPEDDWKIQPIYSRLVRSSGRASDCISCRSCERYCPQNLPISTYIHAASAALE